MDDLLPFLTGEWGVIVWIARWMQIKAIATQAWAISWENNVYQE